jgi:MSHA biogenesis protein MshN
MGAAAMSIINRMLQELEERHDDAAQQRLPGIVRAVPARLSAVSYAPAGRVLLIIVLVLVVGFLSWLVASTWKARQPQPVPSTAIVQTVLPATPIVPKPPLKFADLLPERNLNPQPNVVPPMPIAPAPIAPEPVMQTPRPEMVQQQAPPKSAMPVEVVGKDETIAAKVKPEAVPKPAPEVDYAAAATMKQVSKEQRADFRYREALSFINQGRIQEAQATLEDALRLDPRNVNTRQVLLGLFLEAKRYPQAEQLLQDALQLNLSPASYATALARVQFERGDQVAALSTLEKYASQASASSEFHGFYAALLQRAGRHGEAITQFQAALKLQPNQANWLMGLGISLQSEKRYAEAEQAYSRARAANTLAPDLQAFVEQRLKQVQQAH